MSSCWSLDGCKPQGKGDRVGWRERARSIEGHIEREGEQEGGRESKRERLRERGECDRGGDKGERESIEET